MKILNIRSNPNPQSVSDSVMQQFIESYTATHSDAQVETLDLVTNPLPHLDGDALSAAGKTSGHIPGDLTAKEQEWMDSFNALIDQFLSADIIAIAAPMWNFSIPSGLKAYIDHIVQVDKTFRFTENGAEGLIKGKKLIIAGARGGDYSQMSQLEFHVSYLKALFGFLGISDIETITAEATMMSDGAEQRITAAKEQAANIAKEL